MMLKPVLVLLTCSLMLISWSSAQDMGVLTAESVYRTITVDGDISDWEGIPPAVQDTTGDGGIHYDFAAAYLANDLDNLYIRITFSEPQPYGSFYWYMNIAFDTDLNTMTGHQWPVDFGSEFNVQGPQLFDQRCGEWVCIIDEPSSENGWGNFFNINVAPLNDQNVLDIELAIPRDVVYKNMEDGNPGLSNPDETPLFDPEFNDFVVLFETENENFESVEWMPDPDTANAAGIIYTFEDTPADVTLWNLH
ncbi:MAG: hypothetical protein ACOX5R_12705 [bacterium]|jgi:hypothetical protein